MAMLIDGKAQEAIERRRRHGRPAAISVRITSMRHGVHAITADFVAPEHRAPRQVILHAGDVLLFVDLRIARYARWRDVTISAGSLGPIHYLLVPDELELLIDLASWERIHPALKEATPDHVPASLIA
jgi:hypothetical protein